MKKYPQMTWKNPQHWQTLVQGTDCPICKDAHQLENAFSYLVAEQEFTYFRFTKAQDPPGLCTVILKRHATEIFQLESNERDGYFREVSLAAKAVFEVFSPVKMHYGIFGSICPHIHCHLIPKYAEDDPHAPIAFGDNAKLISSERGEALVESLRDALRDSSAPLVRLHVN